MSTMIDQAIEYALDAHISDYLDHVDLGYEAHLLKVAELIRLTTNDEEEIAAAILHDVLKMTSHEYGHICQAFPRRVADIVDELSLVGIADTSEITANIWLASFIDDFTRHNFWAFVKGEGKDLSYDINVARNLEGSPVLKGIIEAMLLNWEK